MSSPGHLFQIGPSYAGGDPGGADDAPHIEDFRGKGLEATAFQECDARYPHAQWTLGMAGRPGGTYWVITGPKIRFFENLKSICIYFSMAPQYYIIITRPES